MCPLLNRDYYVYIIIVRSEKGVHAPQLPIRTSNAKPERAGYNYTSRVYPAKWDILNTLARAQVRAKIGPEKQARQNPKVGYKIGPAIRPYRSGSKCSMQYVVPTGILLNRALRLVYS